MSAALCQVSWSGRVPYGEALALMSERVDARQRDAATDALILLEHPHVITTGRRGGLSNLLAGGARLAREGIRVHHVGRGGDVTYHGPGQLVGYPIVDLSHERLGPRAYVEGLERTLSRALTRFGIACGPREGCTGVWVRGTGDRPNRKIAAIGVQIQRRVTSHGFALNVSTDLSKFDLIVPCGIQGAGVTSIEKETARSVSVEDVIPHLVDAFGEVFGRRMTWDVATLTPAR